MSLRLPWLPFTLIDDLAGRIRDGDRVFEYGGGGSTLWFLDRGAHVVTVEHHPGWAAQLRNTVDVDRWTMLERSLDGGATDYVDAIAEFEDESFDLVIVDGRERSRCAMAAMDKVKPGGWLIVDDADRPRYAAALADIGWPRTDYVAFAPAKPTLAYTAVLQKPS
jgi:predicted O-methyltransferase YrrM